MERIITEARENTSPQLEQKKTQKQETTKNITINAAVISHRGCVRSNNEDNFFIDGDLMPDNDVDEGAAIRVNLSKEFHLLAVCDGMGGLQGGERASSIAVHSMDILNQYFPRDSVERAINSYNNEACRLVYEDSIELGEEGKEGTTMAMLYVADGVAHVANIGDSRVYLLRMGKLYQLSYDDAPVFRMMKKGELTREQMRKHPKGNRIEAFIGMPQDRKPSPYGHHLHVSLCAGDRFLLCSDGLSDLLMHDEIQRRLAETADPMAAASQLIWRALEMSGKDNTTCIIADFSAAGMPKPTAVSVAGLPKER